MTTTQCTDDSSRSACGARRENAVLHISISVRMCIGLSVCRCEEGGSICRPVIPLSVKIKSDCQLTNDARVSSIITEDTTHIIRSVFYSQHNRAGRRPPPSACQSLQWRGGCAVEHSFKNCGMRIYTPHAVLNLTPRSEPNEARLRCGG